MNTEIHRNKKPFKKVTNNMTSTMKLASSASDQNVYFTYLCLLNEIKPSEHNITTDETIPDDIIDNINADHDQTIQVERSKAHHELLSTHKSNEVIRNDQHTDPLVAFPKPVSRDGEPDINIDSETHYNPNIIKLTKMKWLTEDQVESPDSSSPSVSPSSSETSTCSHESDDMLDKRMSFGDKCLSTILRLDKEHNMFGLSSITIVGAKTSRKIRKENKPVFPQTAIIQVCCGRSCCNHKSNTDLPSSLKCGGCRSCCLDPTCPTCTGPCAPRCDDPPCPTQCSSFPAGKCSCKSCPPIKCMVDCTTCFGMKILLNTKPKYDPSPIELTPRSSCVLQKPLVSRSCHHLPQCVPPSSCFPYLMPCYWPSRAGAPCNTPARCFHNPPCRPPRKRQVHIPLEERCPTNRKCEDEGNKTTCTNIMCPGSNSTNNSSTNNSIEGKKKREKKKNLSKCECSSPICSNCFVLRPKKRVETEDTALKKE